MSTPSKEIAQQMLETLQRDMQKLHDQINTMQQDLNKTKVWEPGHKQISHRITELEIEFARKRNQAAELQKQV